MDWIFIAFFIASIIHMVEEYFYPGGFMEVMQSLNPEIAPLVTVPATIIINGLQLLLCIAAMMIGKNALIFSLSIAGLLFINGLMHIIGCVRVKGYAPGAITGAFLYIPISGYAYYLFIGSGQLTLNGALITAILGLLYQAIPIGYFEVASAFRSV